MAKRTVLFDRVNYTTSDGKGGRQFAGVAVKGDVIDLDDSEAERLDALGATAAADADVEPAATPATSAPNPEEVAKVAGIEDRSDEELPPTPQITAADVEAAGKVAGVGNSLGHGVELHDNERTAALAGFLPPEDASTGGGEERASDEDLAAMKADDLVAYLNQHNDDVDRVEAIETERDKPRATVTAAIERIRSAGDGEDSGATTGE